MQSCKVLFVIDKSGFGGVQSIAYTLMNHIFTEVEITYFFLRNINDQYGMTDLKRDDVVYSRAQQKYSLSCFLDFYTLVKDGGFEVVHLNGTKSILFGYLLKRLMPQVKIISHDHSSEFDYKDWFVCFLKLVSGRFDRFLCVSERRKQFLINACKINPAKITVLNNFVDEKRFIRRQEKAVANISAVPDGRSLTIGFVGRLSKIKGCDLLIRALPLIKKEVDRLQVRIAGDGPDREELEKLITTLGMQEDVSFLGYVDEPAEVYAASDIIVIPSRSEEGPISLYEAWMVGVPVVASDAPVIDQRIVDYQTGLFFPSENIVALAQKVIELNGDKELQSLLVENGYEAVKGLTAENYIANLREVYLSL